MARHFPGPGSSNRSRRSHSGKRQHPGASDALRLARPRLFNAVFLADAFFAAFFRVSISWKVRIQDSFDRQGLMGQPGARIAAGRVHIVLPNRPEATQQNGYFHVGATSAIANSAGGHAAFTLFTENTPVLTVEYKINLLAPTVGDHIKAVGT